MPGRLSIRLPLLMLSLLTVFSPLPSALAEVGTPPSASPGQVVVSGDQPGECQALRARFDEQNRTLSQELRQIKRELAALNQNLEKPGLKEAMAGIGYILGLFGIAAFAAARRRDRTTGGG